MEKKNIKETSAYQQQLHTFGRITNVIVVAALIAVPVILTIASGEQLDIAVTLKALVGIGVLMGVMAVVEFATYAPILGAGATYLTFITGNTVNMKLPAAMSSNRVADIDPNTPEGEIISTIAVAVSSLVTIVVLVVGLAGLSFILPVLQSPMLKPAFDNLMPALMGALATPVLLKDFKTAPFPMLLVLVLVLIMGFTAFNTYTSLLMPVIIVFTILCRYFLYKREMKKSET